MSVMIVSSVMVRTLDDAPIFICINCRSITNRSAQSTQQADASLSVYLSPLSGSLPTWSHGCVITERPQVLTYDDSRAGAHQQTLA